MQTGHRRFLKLKDSHVQAEGLGRVQHKKGRGPPLPCQVAEDLKCFPKAHSGLRITVTLGFSTVT